MGPFQAQTLDAPWGTTDTACHKVECCTNLDGHGNTQPGDVFGQPQFTLGLAEGSQKNIGSGLANLSHKLGFLIGGHRIERVHFALCNWHGIL